MFEREQDEKTILGTIVALFTSLPIILGVFILQDALNIMLASITLLAFGSISILWYHFYIVENQKYPSWYLNIKK